MKKLNVNEMMMVNGGRTLTAERWDWDRGIHIMVFDGKEIVVEPIEENEVKG